jgi:hypothetical protein
MISADIVYYKDFPAMLFHKTTKRVMNWAVILVGILVILSMILLYFPAVWQS